MHIISYSKNHYCKMQLQNRYLKKKGGPAGMLTDLVETGPKWGSNPALFEANCKIMGAASYPKIPYSNFICHISSLGLTDPAREHTWPWGFGIRSKGKLSQVPIEWSGSVCSRIPPGQTQYHSSGWGVVFLWTLTWTYIWIPGLSSSLSGNFFVSAKGYRSAYRNRIKHYLV